jgi:hypothetical protein
MRNKSENENTSLPYLGVTPFRKKLRLHSEGFDVGMSKTVRQTICFGERENNFSGMARERRGEDNI